MNRQRLYMIGAAWLMLVLLIGCVATTGDAEPQADAGSTQEQITAGDDVAATAVPTDNPAPGNEEEESEMSNDGIEIQPTKRPLEITPQPDKPAIQITPIPLPDLSASANAKPVMPLPDDPTAQEQIGKAEEDLAARLKIDVAEVELVEYQTVTWRDGSLGCPRPGMAYTQALVEGYRIQLQVGGTQYDYHGADGRDPFYCQNPSGKADTEPAPVVPGLDNT